MKAPASVSFRWNSARKAQNSVISHENAPKMPRNQPKIWQNLRFVITEMGNYPLKTSRTYHIGMPSKGIPAAEIKLARAAKHIRAIRRSIAAYAASKPHKIVKKTNRKKQLNVPNSPPVEIAVMAGYPSNAIRLGLFGFQSHREKS